MRSDIREDRQGAPLKLGIRVIDAAPCAPIANAMVDVWHCDATGLYSGFESASKGGPPTATDATTYLRGGHLTNAEGIATFITIYPGCYRGRTVHIHLKVLLNSKEMLATQLHFDEKITAKVYEKAPYATQAGRDSFPNTDGIFPSGGGHAPSPPRPTATATRG